MKLPGYDSSANSLYFPMSYDRTTRTYKADRSFLQRMQQTQEAKKPPSLDQMRDTLSCSGTDLQIIYNQLSSASRDVLERINAGAGDIGKEEWNSLCKELKEAGALTDEDLLYTNPSIRLIPVGYTNDKGEFVKYEPSLMKEMFLEEYGTVRKGSMLWFKQILNDWEGDPLQYLKDWSDTLYDWRSVLARQRAADGSPMYDNFDGITCQIDACGRVTDMVKRLGALAETAAV